MKSHKGQSAVLSASSGNGIAPTTGISLSDLYQLKQRVFNNAGIDVALQFLVSKGLTANMITLVSLALGALSVFFVFRDPLLYTVCISHRAVLDTLDGYCARRFNLQSALGDKLDHWGDLGIHTGLLVSAVLFSNVQLLAAIALLFYVGEYALLKSQKALTQKFPSGGFAFFFIFGLYAPGLGFQIAYQLISQAYFQLFIKNRKSR